MKNFLGLSAFLLAFNVSASTYEMTCQVTHNLATVLETEVSINDGEKNKEIGEFDEFRFYLSSKENRVFELQSFEMNTPSRSYATARLTERDSFVELSIWNRDYLLEARCRLK